MSATIDELQAAIARERAYQDRKWGTVQENPHALAGWLLIAERELDEAIEAWIRKPGDREAKAELLQFVSTGEACYEQWLAEMGDGGAHESVGEWLLQVGERPLEEWLGCMKAVFVDVWRKVQLMESLSARFLFSKIVNVGKVALLQHGIVERDAIETNAYRVVGIAQTCAALPTQWEGADDQGRYVYARFRHGQLTVDINEDEIFRRSIRVGESGDGVMSYEELKTLTKGVIEWPE